MKLTDNERRLLPNLELNAETPLAQLAKSLNVSVNTVRHAISNLTEKGVIRHYPFIDVFPLGYRLFNISLALRAKQMAEQDRILKTIIAHPQVSWVCELGGGEYRYLISFIARRSSELLDFLETIGATAPGIIQRKAVMDQLTLTLFPAKFLTSRIVGAQHIGWGSEAPSFNADRDDYRILNGMMAGYTSMRALARKLGMAHSSLYHRLNRLRRAGVFKGFIYLRNIHALNHSEFKFNISVANRTPSLRNRLFSFAKEHPHVIFFVELMGEWDFEMDIEVETPAHAGLICDQLRARFSDEITDLKIEPILCELKVACFPLEPLDRAVDGSC